MMSRRHFLETATGAVLSGNLASAPAQSTGRLFIQPRTGGGPYKRTGTESRPNIFLITADMVSPDLYHPDRPLSKSVNLPNIRSLIMDGTFFSNGFCTVPLCSPSRASCMTGRYSYIQGNGERHPRASKRSSAPRTSFFPSILRLPATLRGR